MIKKVFVLSLLCAQVCFSAVELPKIFSNHMMFQRDIPVNIWGKAEPNAEIEIKFDGKSAKTKADESGKWKLSFPAMSANKNPQDLVILENGNAAKSISDILVGEIWIAGGQSNMEFPLSKCVSIEAARERADNLPIRYFAQGNVIASTPQEDSPKGAAWFACSKKTVGWMSGVAFHFAEDIYNSLDVPVGILYSSSGATEMATWIPLEHTKKSEFLNNYTQEFLKEAANYDKAAYEKRLADFNAAEAAYKAACEKAEKEGKRKPSRNWDAGIAPNEISPRFHFRSPTYHFNSTVAPIVGYGIRGVIWYQGESDSRAEKFQNFARSFDILIGSWRELWNMPEMPFLYVQLASYAEAGKPDGDSWAKTRAVQTSCLKIPHTGMANIIDTGMERDIHPTNKEPVGKRLALIALHDVYGKKEIKAQCPMMKSVKYFNDRAEVTFDTFKRKLEERGEPRGFEVLVADKWQPANAQLNGKRVILKPAEGAGKISGVRYLWKNWAAPEVWLFNEDGLPANSFCDQKS